MSQTQIGPVRELTYRTPRWVKVLGITALIAVLLVGMVMLATGSEHGPGRHMLPASVTESGEMGGHTSSAQHGG